MTLRLYEKRGDALKNGQTAVHYGALNGTHVDDDLSYNGAVCGQLFG